MLFGITICTVPLCTADISIVDIFSDNASSVVLFPSKVYSSVILNDPNISSSASIPVVS